MRLDKLLANSGFGSRKEVKTIIKKGGVTVNGTPERNPNINVDINTDTITVNGTPLVYKSHRYYMMNKPAGVLSATEDSAQRTVLDLMDANDRKGVFPVGRLDKDTTGLLLLTDDGHLAHDLLSPRKHVEKKYLATLSAPVTDEDIAAFAEGVRINDDFTALPAKLEVIPDADRPMAFVTITEGKFHQVKRMFIARGNEVIALKRLSMGPLTLDDDLPEGSYREILYEDIITDHQM